MGDDEVRMIREISTRIPAGGIGFHGSTWKKAESIRTEGLIVSKSKQDELFMYITTGNREGLDIQSAIRYASAYAVSRGIDQRPFSSIQEAANRSETILPEVDLPTVSIFFSDDEYKLNQRFTLETPDKIFHASKASSTETDVPARLVRGTVRLEESDMRDALKTAQTNVSAQPVLDATITDNTELDSWLDQQGIQRTSPIAHSLSRELLVNHGLTPQQAAYAIERSLFDENCTERLSAKIALVTHRLAIGEKTENQS